MVATSQMKSVPLGDIINDAMSNEADYLALMKRLTLGSEQFPREGSCAEAVEVHHNPRVMTEEVEETMRAEGNRRA